MLSFDNIDELLGHLPKGKSLAFVSGYFNILHPGHLRLLQFAAKQADHVVVGVLSDKLVPDATVRDKERLDNITTIRSVGSAFIIDCDLTDIIRKLSPHVVVRGWEHKNKRYDEDVAIAEYGGIIVYGGGDTKFSSFDLLQREFQCINYSSIEKPMDYPKRHGFNMDELKEVVHNISRLKVCVIGDIIIDEYRECDPVGMSREDPTIVVRPIQTGSFLGGAGIVAAHASKLGADVHFLSVVGDDQHGRFSQDQLDKVGLSSQVIVDKQRSTTHKIRYRAHGKTMLRVNDFTDCPISDTAQASLFQYVESIIHDLDIILFSDFNYGVLPQSLVDKVSALAINNNVMFVADSQSSSQVGNIARFENARLISPTEYEVRLALQNYNDGLVALSEKLRERVHADHVFITLGSEGFLVHSKLLGSNREHKWQTDRIPALNTAPKDPAGAGDALLVSSSLAMASGATIWQSAYLGAIAAACQVGRIGNIPLTSQEILTELEI